MKRTLSLVLAAALVLGSIPAGFAASTAGETLKGYGVVAGDSNGSLNENKTITRAEMMTVLARLLGKYEEASKYSVPSTSKDVAGHWNAKVIAFAEKEGWTSGKGNGMFDPNGNVTLQEAAAFMLKALGYTVDDYAKVVDQATKLGLLKDVSAKDATAPVVRGDIFTAALNTLNTAPKDATAKLGEKLGYIKVTGLAVSEIKAATAKSFAVKFNRAAADADKLTFSVKRSTTDVTVTTTWNADKTEATLTFASALPEATYSVAVLADGKELSKKDVAITAQKIAKIEVTSDKLAIVTSGSNTTGYVTYKAFDQYGNDITTTYLTNNIDWKTGVGSFDTSTKGVLKLTPSNSQNLLVYSNVVITGLDTTANVTVTKSLPTTTAVGTLSDFKFGAIDSVKLVDGDLTTVFYIPFTATDMSGNETKNYDLVSAGLLDANSVTSGTDLTVSSQNISVKIVKDPANTKNAAVELRVKGSENNLVDLPVTITAMTLTGKSSTVSTKLAKAVQLETFTMMSPVESISSAQNVEIPFEAFDQNGAKLTKFADVDQKINLSPAGTKNGTVGLYFEKRPDGTAKLMFHAPTVPANSTSNTTTYVTATVKNTTTGKMSSLSLTTQKLLEPTNIAFDASVLVNAMESGAVQKLDFGYDWGGITVYDQYDRVVDFTNKDYTGYNVVIKSDNTNVVNINGGAAKTLTSNIGGVAPEQQAVINAVANEGSTTITVQLVRTSDNKVMDEQQAVMSVIKPSDIKSFTSSTVSKPIYAVVNAANALTAKDLAYKQEIDVYGKTLSGTKVFLAGTPVINTSSDNTVDFTIAATGGAYDSVRVLAVRPVDKTKTSASANITMTINHLSEIFTVTTPVTSSTVEPVAKTAEIYVEGYRGVTIDGNEVTLPANKFTGTLQRFLSTGVQATDWNDNVFFRAIDTYGKKGLTFVDFKVVDQTAGRTVSINSNGTLSANSTTLASGDFVTISAVTNNGLVQTIKFIIR